MHTRLRVLSLPFISVFPKWSWASHVLWWAPLPSAPISSTSSSEISYKATCCLPKVLFLESAFGKWQNQNIQHKPLHIFCALGAWSDGIASGGICCVWDSSPHLEPRCAGPPLSPRYAYQWVARAGQIQLTYLCSTEMIFVFDVQGQNLILFVDHV